MPFTIPSLILTLGVICGITYWGLRLAHRRSNATLQVIFLSLAMSAIGFSTIGMVLLRANANPPINMNNPSDPIRVIPYLNREQYGERPLLFGPQFNAKPAGKKTADRYGRVGDKYEVVDHKTDYTFDAGDKVFFPRMGHYESDRSPYYKIWMDVPQQQELGSDRPDVGDNCRFSSVTKSGGCMFRYFMWNFAGRQNFEQGFGPWINRKVTGNRGFLSFDKWRLLIIPMRLTP